MRYQALILAGDRKAGDPVAALGGVDSKALTPVLGISMLSRVVRTLQSSKNVAGITLVGPGSQKLERDPQMRELLQQGDIQTIEPAASPSKSTAAGLRHIDARPVFVTTADHALLRPDIVDHFLEQSALSGCDVTVALTPLPVVMAGFPGSRRTAIKLKGGPFCGSNMFAFMTPGSEKLAQFWQDVEQRRKDPRLVILQALGVMSALKYLCGRLSLEEAMRRISNAVGLRIGAVIMPFAEAAVDIDTVDDFLLVEEALRQRAAI